MTSDNYGQVIFRRSIWFLCLSIVIWVILIFPRGLGINSIAESLWTEDAMIFLNQVFRDGVAAVLTPYQGYVNTFQRLYVLLALYVPLSYVPHLLFAGSCIAFLILVYVTDTRLRRRDFSTATISVALLCMVFQPHGGEVYFSLTNTQWVLGLALAVYLALSERDADNYLEIAILAIACLTGPFSILMLPVVGLQVMIQREIWPRWKTLAVLVCGASVQLTQLALSNRMKNPASTGDKFGAWAQAIETFFLFGAVSKPVAAIAVCFWLLTLFGLLLRRTREDFIASGAIYLFCAAAVMFSVSLYSVSLWSSVTSVSPLGGGARYYFAPYGLIVLGALVLLRKAPRLQLLAAGFFLVVCCLSFHPGKRENMQWQAFARFFDVQSAVDLPINPQWSTAPTWAVVPPKGLAHRSIAPIVVPFQISEPERSVDFALGDVCASHTYLGLEIDLWREHEGIARLHWGESRLAIETSANRLYRYYTSGKVTMRFAFRRSLAEKYVRLVPSSAEGRFDPDTIRIFCL